MMWGRCWMCSWWWWWWREKKIPERSGFLVGPWTTYIQLFIIFFLTKTYNNNLLGHPWSHHHHHNFISLLFSLPLLLLFFIHRFPSLARAYFFNFNKFPPNMMRELKQVSDRLSNCDLSSSLSLTCLLTLLCDYVESDSREDRHIHTLFG